MTFQERYKYNSQTDLLGKGGFARVYKATDSLLDRIVAVKVFNASGNEHYTVLEEIKKVIRYEHPNLLRYYDVAILDNINAFGEKENMQVGIMEYANAGDLKTFVQKNPNSNLLYDLLQQILKGLEFLHSKGIIHRDLKPQNILLTEENGKLNAKISDFGISKNMDSNTNSASMTIGTIEYMAPEQFSPNKYGINGKISTNVDLWSFGIMVHELITNDPPFGQRNGSTTAEQIMSSILSANLPEEINNISEPYQTIIKKCLVADAKQRVQSSNELIKYFDKKNIPIIKIVDRKGESTKTKIIDTSNISKGNETEILPLIAPPIVPSVSPNPPNTTVAEKTQKSKQTIGLNKIIKKSFLVISVIFFTLFIVWGISFLYQVYHQTKESIIVTNETTIDSTNNNTDTNYKKSEPYTQHNKHDPVKTQPDNSIDIKTNTIKQRQREDLKPKEVQKNSTPIEQNIPTSQKQNTAQSQSISDKPISNFIEKNTINIEKFNENMKWIKNMMSVNGCNGCKNDKDCKDMVLKRLREAISINPGSKEAIELLNCLEN